MLESDAGAQGCRWGPIVRHYSVVEGLETAAALWQPIGTAGANDRVAGCHEVAGLSGQAPGIGYRENALFPASDGGCGYRISFEETAQIAGGSTIRNAHLGGTCDVGDCG